MKKKITQQIIGQWLGIIFPIVCVLIGSIVIIAYLIFQGEKNKQPFEPLPFNPAIEHNYSKPFSALFNKYQEMVNTKQTSAIGRNFFVPAVEKNERLPFFLKEVVFKPLVFMYKGNIEKSSNVMIAQINWGEKTYFVQRGDTIKDWRILDVTKQKVLVQNNEGETLELILHQQTFSKKPYAVFGIFSTASDVTVKIGDSIEGYKVLDITRDAVILLQGEKTITIRK